MQTTKQIAENHIFITRSLFDEGMRAASGGAYKKTIQKLALSLAALYLAVAAWLIYSRVPLVFLAGETIFLAALLFWLAVMLPGTKRRSSYKAMTHNTDTVPERHVRFYQDHLTVIPNTGKETVISCADVINWQETPHLYILKCQNKISVLLDKNGFVSGDFHAVLEILKHVRKL